MKRNLSIVVITQKADGDLTPHSLHTTITGEGVTNLDVHEKIKDFLTSVGVYHLDDGEKILSLSHSIFS